ncbi:hypothetical protein VE03_00308 [Pseudogymnoascus sp. 23342-1-I1]|nr:hypothetical protein VE03_00308 [Pseudogymnoascus sp. 23342-1-I1]
MTSPSSSSAASSPIPMDAYVADLYSLASPALSPVHSRSQSPICGLPASGAMARESIRDSGDHDNFNKHIPIPNHSNIYSSNTVHQPHRPPPYRPRLEFTPARQAPYRPSLSFLHSGDTSPASVSASTNASPLTPESPSGGCGGENARVKREKYTGYPLPLVGEEKDVKGGRVSAQKIKRRAQNRAAQRAFRARQAERVRELEKEVEGLRGDLEVLRGTGRRRGCLCG